LGASTVGVAFTHTAVCVSGFNSDEARPGRLEQMLLFLPQETSVISFESIYIYILVPVSEHGYFVAS
jgi:hypothetical protein